METIKVQWELTPSQRTELLNALLLAQKQSPASEDIQILITLTSRLKCGDPRCSFCGDPTEDHDEESDPEESEESEPDPAEEYSNRIDYEYEKWRDQ
jgi:hypothetical protein